MTTNTTSSVRFDRIERAQALMREQGVAAIVVMNHDDYRWFFGIDRAQPRAIIPATGAPALIAFTAEEEELRTLLGGPEIMIWGSVGGQINDVVSRLRAIGAEKTAATPASGTHLRVAMQQWFETPAFLVDMFRKVNPGVELVSSDPIMDPLRAVKEPAEIATMTAAQRIAGIGMDRARTLLRDGATAHEIATEVMYAMMRAGAQRTSTPIYVNVGRETCMLHGWQSPRPMRTGDLVVIDLTPVVDGYCANLARTFVLGEPDARQRSLLEAYAALIPVVRDAMRPGATVAQLDACAAAVLRERGLATVPGERDRARPGPALRRDARLDDHPAPPQRAPAGGHDRDDRPPDPGDPGLRRRAPRGRLPGDARGGEILVPYPIAPVVSSSAPVPDSTKPGFA